MAPASRCSRSARSRRARAESAIPERPRLRIGVLASGRGSNFQALVAAARAGRMPAHVIVLISDRAGAGAVALARAEGIEAVVVPPREHPGREAHDKAVTDALEARRVAGRCLGRDSR